MTLDELYVCCSNLQSDCTITLYPTTLDKIMKTGGKTYTYDIELVSTGLCHIPIKMFWVEYNHLDVVLKGGYVDAE